MPIFKLKISSVLVVFRMKCSTTNVSSPGFTSGLFPFQSSCFQHQKDLVAGNACKQKVFQHCRAVGQRCCHIQVPYCTDKSELPPGTTSLVLRLGSDLVEVKQWLRNWLHDTVFAASDRATSVNQSVAISPEGAMLRFHATDGAIRGLLSFVVTKVRRDTKSGSDSPDHAEMRITSTSRFLSATGGGSTATLPGERRLLRSLVSEADRAFPTLSVVYKAPYIRLRQLSNKLSSVSQYNLKPVTMFVAELRDGTSLPAMVNLLHKWAYGLQYGAAEIGLFMKARLPPLSIKSSASGVTILFPVVDRNDSDKLIPNIVATARNRRLRKEIPTASDISSDEVGKSNNSLKYKVLVLVTATFPAQVATNIILSR